MEPSAIPPKITFEAGYSLRWPDGGSMELVDGQFMIRGTCEVVDANGTVIATFGG